MQDDDDALELEEMLHQAQLLVAKMTTSASASASASSVEDGLSFSKSDHSKSTLRMEQQQPQPPPPPPLPAEERDEQVLPSPTHQQKQQDNNENPDLEEVLRQSEALLEMIRSKKQNQRSFVGHTDDEDSSWSNGDVQRMQQEFSRQMIPLTPVTPDAPTSVYVQVNGSSDDVSSVGSGSFRPYGGGVGGMAPLPSLARNFPMTPPTSRGLLEVTVLDNPMTSIHEETTLNYHYTNSRDHYPCHQQHHHHSSPSRSPTPIEPPRTSTIPATVHDDDDDDDDDNDDVPVLDYTNTNPTKRVILPSTIIPDFTKTDPNAKWESITTATIGDDDYVPIADYTVSTPTKKTNVVSPYSSAGDSDNNNINININNNNNNTSNNGNNKVVDDTTQTRTWKRSLSSKQQQQRQQLPSKLYPHQTSRLAMYRYQSRRRRKRRRRILAIFILVLAACFTYWLGRSLRHRKTANGGSSTGSSADQDTNTATHDTHQNITPPNDTIIPTSNDVETIPTVMNHTEDDDSTNHLSGMTGSGSCLADSKPKPNQISAMSISTWTLYDDGHNRHQTILVRELSMKQCRRFHPNLGNMVVGSNQDDGMHTIPPTNKVSQNHKNTTTSTKLDENNKQQQKHPSSMKVHLDLQQFCKNIIHRVVHKECRILAKQQKLEKRKQQQKQRSRRAQ